MNLEPWSVDWLFEPCLDQVAKNSRQDRKVKAKIRRERFEMRPDRTRSRYSLLSAINSDLTSGQENAKYHIYTYDLGIMAWTECSYTSLSREIQHRREARIPARFFRSHCLALENAASNASPSSGVTESSNIRWAQSTTSSSMSCS